jgi:hypothetical protein
VEQRHTGPAQLKVRLHLHLENLEIYHQVSHLLIRVSNIAFLSVYTLDLPTEHKTGRLNGEVNFDVLIMLDNFDINSDKIQKMEYCLCGIGSDPFPGLVGLLRVPMFFVEVARGCFSDLFQPGFVGPRSLG